MVTYPFEFPQEGAAVVTTVNAPHSEQLTPATILGFVDTPKVFIDAYPGHASVFFTEIPEAQIERFLNYYNRDMKAFIAARDVYIGVAWT